MTTRGEPLHDEKWCCWRESHGRPGERCYFYGATPDEARAKAAAWVREQARARMVETSQAACAEAFKSAQKVQG